jgi:hypothetical protein
MGTQSSGDTISVLLPNAAGLAIMGESGTVPELLPMDADGRADLVLAGTKPAPPPRPR